MQPDETIETAINQHCYLALTYGDLSLVIEPRIFGTNPNGHRVMSGWQVSGGDALGKPFAWFTFQVSEIRDLRLLPGTNDQRQQSAAA
jgi:hypothetical protein